MEDQNKDLKKDELTETDEQVSAELTKILEESKRTNEPAQTEIDGLKVQVI